MAERNLLFLDEVAPAFTGYDPDSSEAQQRSFLEQFVHTHNAPSATLRQRLNRIPTASPDLLGIILKQGKV